LREKAGRQEQAEAEHPRGKAPTRRQSQLLCCYRIRRTGRFPHGLPIKLYGSVAAV
jgi:hypothetical protein